MCPRDGCIHGLGAFEVFRVGGQVLAVLELSVVQSSEHSVDIGESSASLSGASLGPGSAGPGAPPDAARLGLLGAGGLESGKRAPAGLGERLALAARIGWRVGHDGG